MINILKKIFRLGHELLVQEKTITIVNLGTTIIISFFIWMGFLSFYFFNQVISYLQERLDFSIYFKSDIQKEDIQKIKKILENFPEVNEVVLVTQEEAFKKFQKEIKTNPVISRALGELNINPLVDYLIVKAKSPETYSKIADYLEKSPYKTYIDYITYFENQKVIKKVISISNQMKVFLSVFILAILALSTLIIFNTILVSIYSQKEDIEILRLIGASNWFIRGPFLIYSFLISLFGYIISLGILVFFFDKTSNFWLSLISNFHPSSFLFDNFFLLNGIAFSIILFINWSATFMALEKYLKI